MGWWSSLRDRVVAREVPPAVLALESGDQPAPDPRPRRRSAGRSAHAVYGLLLEREANKDVRGSKWYGTPTTVGEVDRMLSDAHVARSVNEAVQYATNADWDFEPASDDAVDQQIAAACRRAFFHCLPWEALVSAILYATIRHGAVLVEWTDDVQTQPVGLGPATVIAPTGAIPYELWSVDRWIPREDNGRQLEAIVQRSAHGGGATITTDRLLRFTWQQVDSDFSGVALIRPAYGPWKVKLALSVIDAIRHERAGVPIPRVTLPDGLQKADLEQERDLVAEYLEEIRAAEDAHLILPHGAEFAWEVTQGVATDLGSAIERCNRDIAYCLGVAHLLLGQQGGSGSYALSQTQQGAHHAFTERLARWFAGVFNHGPDGFSPVSRYVRLNWGERALPPRLVARNLPTRDWSDVVPQLAPLAQAGIVRPDAALEAQVRRVIGMPPAEASTRRPAGPVQEAA